MQTILKTIGWSLIGTAGAAIAATVMHIGISSVLVRYSEPLNEAGWIAIYVGIAIAILSTVMMAVGMAADSFGSPKLDELFVNGSISIMVLSMLISKIGVIILVVNAITETGGINSPIAFTTAGLMISTGMLLLIFNKMFMENTDDDNESNTRIDATV